MSDFFSWLGVSVLKIAWSGGLGMIQYRIPIRNNSTLTFQYTFKDQDGSIIDLTGFSHPVLELKRQGQVYSSSEGRILAAANGVTEAATSVVGLGIWDAQFYADGSQNRVWGEVCQFRVVANVEDLTISQLAVY